ncbi:di-heme oxidoredictase family protein [Gaoshiqia sp. Z1-71]|uniref:di-heme oxidoredictase family protein n=1 Tax=Gaoshiqia hydrogeniformans TaxID=3290090 RepID=UPI003BF80445
MKITVILSIVIIISAIMAIMQGCSELEPPAPIDDEVLDGPLEGLSYQLQAQHLAGDEAFSDVFTAETGLGPLFVATSCVGCHAGDGKGHPFTTLTRFGQVDSMSNQFLHLGGPQLQNRSIPGYEPEQIPEGATFSKMTPPAVTGLGFLELVSDGDILAMTDPEDADADGISGVPNWIDIPSFVTPSPGAATRGGKYIGRFGKKAGAYNLLHQTVEAYNQDIGITSTFEPVDVYSGNAIGPEVTDKAVRDVVFYLQTLKAPVQRDQDAPEVIHGGDIFVQIGCADCHTQTLTTGYSPVEALSYKEFHPYTDLLLHDMGPGLDDGYTEGTAKTSEWRTPPLWGLGLSPDAQGGQFFLMHDGRAKSIDEAIQLHGGEAGKSKNGFNQLSQQERDGLIKFLKSL